MRPHQLSLAKQSSWKVMPIKCQNKLKPKWMVYNNPQNYNPISFNKINCALKTQRINSSRRYNLAKCAFGDCLLQQQGISPSGGNIKRRKEKYTSYKSHWIKNMDHMSISGNEPSSVILSQTKSFKMLKGEAQKVPKQIESKRDGVINPQNYHSNQL